MAVGQAGRGTQIYGVWHAGAAARPFPTGAGRRICGGAVGIRLDRVDCTHTIYSISLALDIRVMTDSFFEMRLEYRHVSLHEQEASADPMALFQAWFNAAVDHGIEIPNAMVLATADADGRPSARYVLLKGLDADGFVFYSHSVSNKGAQLQANPRAALVFYWGPLHRQVRVEGNVSEVSAAEADAYFASRPYASRISAWVAPQSSTVTGREFLDQRAAELDRQFAGGFVPRPENWIGYRVRPERMEFWQGRENRLHDRLCYERSAGSGWHMRRLAP